MKYLVAYNVWDKVDMIAYLIEGIVNNFTPAEAEVLFVFDGCKDDSKLAFDSIRPWWLDQRGYTVHVHVSEQEIWENGCHDVMLKTLMQTKCDALIALQDDMRLNRRLVEPLDGALQAGGDKLGIIGGRDGFGPGFKGMWSSPWSQSQGGQKLQHGEVQGVMMVNSGPIVYPRHTYEKVGGPNLDMRAFFIWEEYSARCHKAGLRNLVMGMDITHMKFGRVTATKAYEPSIAARDSAIFQALVPGGLA